MKNIKKNLKYGIGLLTIALVVAAWFYTSIEYIEIESSRIIDDYGTWRIEFSHEILLNEYTEDAVRIYDENLKEIEVDIKHGKNNNTILVAPQEYEYGIGDNYNLIIKRSIGNAKGLQLRNDSSEIFKTNMVPIAVKNIEINEEDYSWIIEFNQNIELDVSTHQSIKVKDEDDKTINISLEYADEEEEDKSRIVVTPQYSQIHAGKEYTLSIEGSITSTENNRLDKKIEEKLEIKQKILEDDELGVYETEYVNNDRPYSWYIDVESTGEFAQSNNGIASVMMAVRWLAPSEYLSVQTARGLYYPNGEAWDIQIIGQMLRILNINENATITRSMTQVKNELKNGNIVIAEIEMNEIPLAKDEESRIGTFYRTSDPVYIIIKGYRVVDDELYFEVYDSNSYGEVFENGEKLGEGRYYTEDSLKEALQKSIVIKDNQENINYELLNNIELEGGQRP